MRFAGQIECEPRSRRGNKADSAGVEYCRRVTSAAARPSDGTVLLEVVVALVLFVGAATIVSSAFNASLRSVERLRLNTHAANLAISVFSELEMGLKTLAVAGPQPFEAPFAGWTWEILADPSTTGPDNGSAFRRIEVVVRHDEPAIVHRLCQVIRIGDLKDATERNPLSAAIHPSPILRRTVQQPFRQSRPSAKQNL